MATMKFAHPRVSLFGFCVAIVTYMILSVIKAADTEQVIRFSEPSRPRYPLRRNRPRADTRRRP